MANKPDNPEAPKAKRPNRAAEAGLELPPAPPPAAQELIRAHLADKHRIEPFELARHVHLGGSRPRSQLITWNPAVATFLCERCPGVVYATGEITDERVTLAQLFDEGLKPFLSGGRTTEERDEITRRYLSGELGDAVLQAGRKLSRRRPAKAARPAVQHRRARVQDWMLTRYAVLGVLARVIEEALDLQRDQPEEWESICDRPCSESTLNRYWQAIPDAKVEAAKRIHQASRQQRN